MKKKNNHVILTIIVICTLVLMSFPADAEQDPVVWSSSGNINAPFSLFLNHYHNGLGGLLTQRWYEVRGRASHGATVGSPLLVEIPRGTWAVTYHSPYMTIGGAGSGYRLGNSFYRRVRVEIVDVYETTFSYYVGFEIAYRFVYDQEVNGGATAYSSLQYAVYPGMLPYRASAQYLWNLNANLVNITQSGGTTHFAPYINGEVGSPQPLSTQLTPATSLWSTPLIKTWYESEGGANFIERGSSWYTGYTNTPMTFVPPHGNPIGVGTLTFPDANKRPQHVADTFAGIGYYQWNERARDYQNSQTTVEHRAIVKTQGNADLYKKLPSNIFAPYDLGATWYSNHPSADIERNLPTEFAVGSEYRGDYSLSLIVDDSNVNVVTFDQIDRTDTTLNWIGFIDNGFQDSPSILGTKITFSLKSLSGVYELSERSEEHYLKVDNTPPVVNVDNDYISWDVGASTSANDLLSGLASIYYKFVPVDAPEPVRDGSWETDYLTAYESLGNGIWDLYVYAEDNATNRSNITKANPQAVIDTGRIILSKDSTVGATLHRVACDNNTSVSVEASCDLDCQNGANIALYEKSSLTYKLTLENISVANIAKGDFLDYLPLGTELIGTPTVTTSGGETVNIHTTTRASGGTYDGRWQIAGDYENLAPGDSFQVDITCSVPSYDEDAGAANIISNQATGTWELAAVSSGTMTSNYANHRVNPSPIIVKASNWGNASHTEDCTSSTSLALTGSCNSDCVAGNSGYVQIGDILSYQLTFENPSNILQYFATGTGARNYDVLPSGVDATGQAVTIDLVDEGGIRTNQFTGVVAPGATGTIYTGSWPDSDGNYLSGLAVTSNRIYQNAGTISIAPKSKLIITVGAKVTGNIGDTLTNQAITGHSVSSNNSSALAITDTGVTTIRSNHVTHRIEQGSTLRKWAYSATPDANNPTVHSVGCPDSGNLLVPGTCLGCTLGNARLQKDAVITYSLTMDNSQNLHKGSDLAGNIASGTPIPGGYIDNKHADVAIPEGLTVDPTTLRVYVTDRNGATVPITNGSGTFSSPVIVNENGTSVTREVLSISGTNVDIKDTGEGTNIFTLSNISLVDNGTRWELTLDNRAYASGSTNDYTGYSITYLFDATVTGEHDSVVSANNAWVNHWKQDNGNRVHNPENPVVSAVVPASILSNSVVHARLSDAVDTLFTKVGADNLTEGLSGAEFALYKWEGSNPPTTAQANHMVDTTVLADTTTMPAGQWVRVQKNATLATLSDIFISSSVPSDLGEVDLGKLPSGTYTLIETKAPSGYTLPVGQWVLTIDSDKTDSGASNWKIEIAGKSNSIAPPAAIRDESVPNAPTYKLVNAEPFLIGLSGLGGTTGMLLTGFIIMAVAGNIYLVRRYKRKEKQEVEND